MLNLNDTLNNIIAVVVVILILSLVVQSLQSVLKKLFKIKSRQIEESLVDLLRNVLNKESAQVGWLGRLIDHSPVSRFLFFWRPDKAKQAGFEVENFYNDIMDGFKNIGRLAQSGKQMLDSIAKGDLLKVLEKVRIDHVLPNFRPGVETAFTHIKTLEHDIQSLRDSFLAGAASRQFALISPEYASIEVALRPLFNDVQTIINEHKVTVPGHAPAAALPADQDAPALLVHDLMALRAIKPEEVLKLLSDAQTKLTAASSAVLPGTEAAMEVKRLAKGLGNIANGITGLRQQLDAALAPFHAKVNEVERWYDITMQSFEERYNRSMKTWAIVIAFLVVAVLNADLFTIYRTIAADGVISKALADQGPDVLKLSKERTDAAKTAGAQTPAEQTRAGQTPAGQTPAGQTAPGQTSAGQTAPGQTPAGQTPAGQETPSTGDEADKEFKQGMDQLKEDVALYTDIGFSPLQWQQVKDWIRTLGPPFNNDWLQLRKYDLRVLLGWIVMTMLLSIGAPFWQDTLESLFGVKNLLRKKGDIQNVEQESGAGQPKT